EEQREGEAHEVQHADRALDAVNIPHDQGGHPFDRAIRRDAALDRAEAIIVDQKPLDSVDQERADQQIPSEPIDRGDLALEESPPLMRHQHYFESEGIIFNPERGLYQHWERQLGDDVTPSLSDELLLRHRGEGVSLILLIFDLAQFIDRPLSNGAIEAVDAELEMIRRAGMKAILRFRYSSDPEGSTRDATPAQTRAHIEALRPALQRNLDVVLLLQAGFIGAWGEWYYSDHWGDRGRWSERDQVARRVLVDQHLESIAPRAVQLRTPGYRWQLYGREGGCEDAPVAPRIGYHNDCFLANESDSGTYLNREEEYPWLAEETRCVPMGGESCIPSGVRSGCENAVRELTALHWSYLNRAYHPEVVTQWREEGCWESIRQRLGYRLSLTWSDLPEEVAPGVRFPFQLSLTNLGYAAPISDRAAWLILEREEDGARWGFKVSETIRGWSPERGELSLSGELSLPRSMRPGLYRWSLSLADPAPGLSHRPAYSIQLANQGIWNSTTGMNDLQVSLRVIQRRAPLSGTVACPEEPCLTALP
ncbi:MAG: DUF4832 domain-containing protein, partial [Myxococcota bacterium]|nr:DUF4832 domain-containing protein [Myxococcota bacterium]